MAANRTPVPLRLFRLARLALHLMRGLAIAWLRFPKLTEAQKQAQKRRWSRTLLSILSVSVREKNAPKELPGCCMLVLNHISWLDVFVIDARFPATFIAKSEVRSWPVVGWLCTLVGTLYIERGKRSEARRARQIIAAELRRGTLVAVFNLLAPISVHSQTRRSLAEKAETAISRALGVPGPQGISRARNPSRKAPGTSADPPGELR